MYNSYNIPLDTCSRQEFARPSRDNLGGVRQSHELALEDPCSPISVEFAGVSQDTEGETVAAVKLQELLKTLLGGRF